MLSSAFMRSLAKVSTCTGCSILRRCFGTTILGGLQTAAFIALGRVFDRQSAHSVDRLLNLASKNPHIFSKAALGEAEA